MNDFKDRLIEEYIDVDARFKRLSSALYNKSFRNKLNEEELSLLEEQRDNMEGYLNVLTKRIDYYSLGEKLWEKSEAKIGDIYKNPGFLDRDYVLEKAVNDCWREMFAKSQPPASLDEYILKAKRGEISPDERVIDHHYLSHDEYRYIIEKYMEAYNIKDPWYNYIDLVINYFGKDAIIDKWVPERTDEDGFTHPGHRGYDYLEDFSEDVKKILEENNIDCNKDELSDKIKKAVIDRIENCRNFYRFDREVSSFEFSVGFGLSPSHNKEMVEKYWKEQGVDLKIEDRNPDTLWELDRYGYVDEEDYDTDAEEITDEEN